MKPGTPPAEGVTLEQALAAAQTIGGPRKGAALEQATTLAFGGIIAVFIAPLGILAVIGNAQDNTIVVSRDAAGKLLFNGGAVPILGPAPTVAKTALIEIFGLAGNDKLALDETNGTLPDSLMFGGAGDDTLIGGSGSDQLYAESGNDTLFGKGGDDFLFGGSGNDVLVVGGDGMDTIEVNGGNGAEVFTVAPNGPRVRFDRTTPAPFFLDIGTAENLV